MPKIKVRKAGAFVELGGAALPTINTVTAAYTLVATDTDKIVEVNSSTGKTVTIPADATTNFAIGTRLTIVQTGAGQVQIDGAAGVTVRTARGNKTVGQFAVAFATKKAANEWVLDGNLTNVGVGAGTLLIGDEFTGTSNVDITTRALTHQGTMPIATRWITPQHGVRTVDGSGTGGGWAGVSEDGSAAVANASEGGFGVIDTGQADINSVVRVGAAYAGGHNGAMVRFFDDQNFVNVYRTDSGALVLRKVVGNSTTNLYTGVAAVNDVIELEAIGDTITLRKNGSVLWTGAGNLPASMLSATKHGFLIVAGGNRNSYLHSCFLYSPVAASTPTADVLAELMTLTAAQKTVTANNQTGTAYTLLLSDAGKVVELNNAAAITVTVPTDATAAFPIGTVIELWQQGAGQVTVAPASGVTIRSSGGLLKTYGQYATASLRKRAANEWVLVGDLVA